MANNFLFSPCIYNIIIMIKNTSISNCLKSDFKPCEKRDNGAYVLRWGFKGEKERVYVLDEETGEPIFTGEIVDSDRCTYECGYYSGELKKDTLDKIFSISKRKPKMRELKVFGEEMGMTEEGIVEWMKGYLMDAISKYDKSKEVEDFSVGGVHLWLDSDMRTKVRENLETSQHKGEEDIVLRHEGMVFPMTLEMGWQLYYAVLDYARETWNVTEIHKAEVPKIGTMQGMIDYEDNYPSAYPPKLSF